MNFWQFRGSISKSYRVAITVKLYSIYFLFSFFSESRSLDKCNRLYIWACNINRIASKAIKWLTTMSVETTAVMGKHQFPKPVNVWQGRVCLRVYVCVCTRVCIGDASGGGACCINADVSLLSSRSLWLMRNSQTVQRQTDFIQPDSQHVCSPSTPLPLPHPSSLHSKQIRAQMRREERRGWWGIQENFTTRQTGLIWGEGNNREQERDRKREAPPKRND